MIVTAEIIEDWTSRKVMVQSPPPDRYHAPKPRQYFTSAQNLQEAVQMVKGEDRTSQDMRVFYRVLGIRSLVYINDSQLASCLVRPNGETTA